MTSTGEDEHVVHPRWVWAAAGVSVAGILVLGLGVMLLSWWVSITGAVVLALGVLVGLRSGWVYDGHATRPLAHEVREVRESDVHEGITPGQGVDNPRAELTAVNLERRRQQILAQAHAARRPFAQLGAWMLLLVGLVLLVAQWTAYPLGATGQRNGLHATYVAIVVALVGLRVATGRGAPHTVAAVIGQLAGLALILLAWLAPHATNSVAIFETLCGAFIVASSSACLDSGRR